MAKDSKQVLGEGSVLTQAERYERLSILDSKVTSVLQLSGILGLLQALPLVGSDLPTVPQFLGLAATLFFISTGLLALYVLRVEFEPDVTLIRKRCDLYDSCRFTTAAGLICTALFIVTGLYYSIL